MKKLDKDPYPGTQQQHVLYFVEGYFGCLFEIPYLGFSLVSGGKETGAAQKHIASI